MNNLNEIHIISAQNRASNPDIRLTQYYLTLAKFPSDSPIEIKIHDGKIVIRPVTH